MLMADTMAVFFVIIGLMLSFVGLWLLTRGLWPDRVTVAADRLERGLVGPFLVGLPISLVAIVLAIAVGTLPGKFGGMTSGALVCLFLIYSHAGVSGLATCIGRRLPSAVDETSPWRPTLRGGVILVLAYLPPVLGWFAILPLSTVIGAGATTLALRSRRSRRSRDFVPSAEAIDFPHQTADVVRG
jgi:hypothetical protein